MNGVIKEITKLLPDRVFIDLKYYKRFHRFPNWKNPRTFNEKIQWLKLHDRNPLYTTIVDKYEAKKYITDKVGPEYVIPSYGVWEHYDEIDFSRLPDRFVLKTTHDCGGVVICQDKSSFDYFYAKTFLESHLKNNYYYEGREWPYKNVKPRILAEAYLEDKEAHDLKDYKFFAFNGVPKAMFIASDRQDKNQETKFDFFDMDFNRLDVINGHPNSFSPPQRPASFDKMKKLTGELSKGFPHLRVDFYEVNSKTFVGELTLSHFSGIVPFEPENWDYTFGDWIELPR